MSKQDGIGRNRMPRGGLYSDGRHRVRSRRRQTEPFGIYRPLTVESMNEVDDFAHELRRDMHTYLRKERTSFSRIDIPSILGATFVTRHEVRQSMGLGMLQKGFEFGKFLRTIQNHDNIQEEALDVSIFPSLKWVGGGYRKFALLFEQSDPENPNLEVDNAQQQLEDERLAIEGLLSEVGAPRIRVLTPDHVTIMKYGSSGDGQNLSRAQKGELQSIAGDVIERFGLGSISLAPIVVGNDYVSPL